jgi:hypothetical protein
MKVGRSKYVTLNSFQGLSCLSSSGCAARWMRERQSPEVKQVQHDSGLLEATYALEREVLTPWNMPQACYLFTRGNHNV